LKRRHSIIVWAVGIIVILLSAAVLVTRLGPRSSSFYLGVSFCGNTVAEAKLLIDKVRNYTNLFVLQSGPISRNETATDEICDYAVASGLKIVVYFGDLDPKWLTNETMWRASWINTTKQRWGDSFLGVYYYDEVGGLYLDIDKNATHWRLPPNSTYDSRAEDFIHRLQREPGAIALKANSTTMFVSDYVLYWFDYLGGFDVVLAQAGWNHTFSQDIALVRGAATMQNKEWGIIITWKYSQPPYLNSGPEIYKQMRTAYEAGAEYIVVFNYPYEKGMAFGTLEDEHFEAIERLWNESKAGELRRSLNAEAVLVLPRNYGWGMRNPQDTIWGFWGPDAKSPQIWEISRKLLSQYKYRLDMIYDDPNFQNKGEYSYVYFWNSTIY
jgi:hypothetical protein